RDLAGRIRAPGGAPKPTISRARQRIWSARRDFGARSREAVMAKGAAEVAPNVYKVLFENDRVRLLEVRMKPGDESALHSHPDYLLYALSGGTVKLTAGSGESGEVDIAAGDAMWRDAEEHSALNTATTERVAMFFELK